MDTPRMAGEIRVTRHGLTIDGEEFPWFIAVAAAALNVSRDDMPSVTVEILAKRVLVDNDMSDLKGTGA